MTSIGQVTAHLRADTAQFRAGVQGAQAQMAKLQGQLHKTQLAFKRGHLTNEQYRRALINIRREAERTGLTHKNVFLRQVSRAEFALADTRLATSRYANALGLTAEKTKAVSKATQGVTKATTRARQGLGTIRSSMASLTAMSLRVKGTFGTLAGGLLQFAAGNVLAIGVIAGIAGIAAVIGRMNRRAKEAAESFRRLVAVYREGISVAPQEIGLGTIQERIARVRTLMAERRAEFLRESRRSQNLFRVGGLGFGARGRGVTVTRLDQRLSPAAKRAAEALGALGAALVQLEAAAKQTAEKIETEQARLTRIGLAAATQWIQVERMMHAGIERAGRTARALTSAPGFGGDFTGGRFPTGVGTLGPRVGGLMSMRKVQDEAATIFEQTRDETDALVERLRKLRDNLPTKEMQAFQTTMVLSFGQMFGEIIGQTKLTAATVIRFFSQIAAAALTSFGGPAGGPLGALFSTVGGALAGLFGQPFHLRRPVRANQPISMQFTMPPANLLQMARGADTQFLLREGMLVAENQGFRLVRNG